MKKKFTTEDAIRIGDKLSLDWDKIDLEQFKMGLGVELEHGLINPLTNITDDDEAMTGKIAWAHLNEIDDYYTRLWQMESEAESEK